MKPHTLLFAVVLCACAIPLAHAQRGFAVTEGDYVVHYNAFPSVFLDPKIAEHYRIDRADDRGVVNIAVRRNGVAGREGRAHATVKGTVSDLVHSRELQFREVRDRDAIYYLAEFHHAKSGTVRFDVEVTPDGVNKPIKASFNRDFGGGQ